MKHLAAVLGFLLIPSYSFAQFAPVIEVRSAIGASHYLHSDLDFNAPTVLVAGRIGVGPFAIEPEYMSASHEESNTFGFGGGSTTQTQRLRFESFAVNLIARGRGRVSPFFGGGIGTYREIDHRTTTSPSGKTEFDLTRGPRAGAQLVGGVDLPVASRLKVFGEGRYELRSFADPGGGSVIQGFFGATFTIR